MKKVCYSPPKTVVFYNNKGVFSIHVVFFVKVELVGGHPCDGEKFLVVD